MQPLISNTFSVSALKEGKDAYVLDLTNQMNSIPVDANGKVTYATTLTTVARIMKGADYVRENIGLPSASSLKIGDVTPTVTNNGGLVTIEWKFTTAHTLTSERYVKTIQMTHDGKSYSADYVARTDKSGAIYDLLTSMTEVPFVRDSDYKLIPEKQTIYCGYTKNQNGTITSFNGKTASHLSNIDSKYYIYYRMVNGNGTFGSWTNMTTSGIEVKNSDTYAGIEFVFSSATAKANVADSNIIDRETVPIVRQSERGYGIVTSVQRDNFTEAQWNTNPGYGVVGHEETWGSTSGIRNNARIGDLFTVVGKATDTGNGHTATYRCTNSSGDLKGICIAHQIAKAGETGNGIKSVTLYRMFTMVFSAPSITDSGWISENNSNYPTPSGLTKEKRYLWQKKVTTYEKTSTTYEISLVAQLDSGICENLLEDTGFNSEGQMEAWELISKYVPDTLTVESGAGIKNGTQGHNAYYDKTAYGSSQLTYKEVLKQKVWEYGTNGIKKIEYSEWYTFSFWVKGTSYTKLNTYIYPSCVNQSADFYIDGVKQSSTPSDAVVSWNVTGSWVRHSVTFKTKNSFYNSSAAEYSTQAVLFRLLPAGTSYNEVYICMPKLEKNTIATDWVEHTNDRMADDIQHVFVGEWSSGTTYFYGGGTGVRHVVRARKSATGAKTYFRMKKRTTSQGYYSIKEPYNDTAYWEQADYLKFVATDFLLAEEIETDKLTVTKIKGKNNCFVVDGDGNVTANSGTFKNVKIQSGEIAGFKISGTGLTNDPFTNDAYVIFRNDARKAFAGIGGNVLPASSGLRAVARFENEDENNFWGLGANYAMILSAKNADRNYAYAGSGHGVLNGHVVGYQLNDFTPSSSLNVIDPNKGKYVLVRGSYGTCYLPTLSVCQNFLGVGTSAKFALDLYVVGAPGSSFTLYGYRSASYGAKCPHMRNPDDNGDMTGGLGMAEGDTCHLLITYDGSNFNAYIMGHLD